MNSQDFRTGWPWGVKPQGSGLNDWLDGAAASALLAGNADGGAGS